MDAGEGMAIPEECRISIPDPFDERVGTESDEEDISSETIEWNFVEWTRELENKMRDALSELRDWEELVMMKQEPKICKLTVGEMSSRSRLETAGGLSQPRAVTIGPFHRQDPTSITDNEKLVIVYLMNLLCGLNLKRSLRKMKNKIKEARHRYSKLDVSKSPSFEDDKSFAEMLLLDSYFVLFTLTIKLRKGPTDYILIPPTPNSAMPFSLLQDDPLKFLDIIFNKDEIALDLLILDNQIPFFVIEELFEELKSEMPLHQYALDFFETIHPRPAGRSTDEINISPPKFLHLLDLFHWSRVPENKYTLPQQQDSIDRAGHIPNATERKESATGSEKFEKPQQPDSIGWARHIPNAVELRESATLFKKKTDGSSLDITFRRRWFKHIIGVLHIPLLHILDYSILIFYNLIVFEIQYSTRGRCTMAFSALMRSLLQSEEDVKLLRQRGILVSSSMTDRELINLFARLSRLTENHQMPHDLSNIYHQVQSHHKNSVSRLCGGIILQYFSRPVVTLSVFVAALLFVPTLLQTIYNMKYHSN